MEAKIEKLKLSLLEDCEFAERFKILDVLGSGAVGYVFLVQDFHHEGKEVALKVLTNNSAFDENTQRRFVEELRACQKIKHEHLVEAYDLIFIGDKIAFTMEYVPGSDLLKIFQTEKLSFDEIDRICIQILDGLHAIHSAGFVHRDLKLENILVRDDGLVKISDLGLIRKIDDIDGLTKTGILLGTAQYMPPEYIHSSLYDARGDIYSVGVLLYELITNVRRLADKNGMAAVEHLIRTDFALPEFPRNIPDKYREIISKAMQVKVKKRYQSALEMKEAMLAPSEKCEENQPQTREVMKRVAEVCCYTFFSALFVGIPYYAFFMKGEAHESRTFVAGTYEGDVNLFGNTGFLKHIEIHVSQKEIRVFSELVDCKSGTIDIVSGKGACSPGSFEIEIESVQAKTLRGKIRDRNAGRVHSFDVHR